MPSNFDSFIVPSPSNPENGEGFIELTPRTARKPKSRLFKKHILNKGTLLYPGVAGGQIEIDDEFVAKIKKNFEDGACDIVQVPVADAKNSHTEDPDRNLGEVVGLEENDGKIYAIIDARDPARADRLGSTILGASAQFSMDYTDTKTGAKVGPTLLHVCATNRPYVTGLDEYEEIIAATADSSDEVVLLTPSTEEVTEQPTEKKEEPRVATLNELVTELNLSHNINVNALKEEVVTLTAALEEAKADAGASELAEQVASLTADNADLVSQVEAAAPAVDLLVKLSAALVESEVVSLSAGETLDAEGVLSAITALAEEKVELAAQAAVAAEAAATAEVDGFVKEGRILPVQRDTMLELRLSNKELFDKLLPEKPLVALSQEEGTAVDDQDLSNQEQSIDSEIARLTAPGGPAEAVGSFALKE